MGNKKSSPEHMTYLKEKDLILLEANTKFNRDKIIQWHNAFLQDCPTGKLDKKTFVLLYQQLEPAESKAEEYAEQVFKGNGNFRQLTINIMFFEYFFKI